MLKAPSYTSLFALYLSTHQETGARRKDGYKVWRRNKLSTLSHNAMAFGAASLAMCSPILVSSTRLKFYITVVIPMN